MSNRRFPIHSDHSSRIAVGVIVCLFFTACGQRNQSEQTPPSEPSPQTSPPKTEDAKPENKPAPPVVALVLESTQESIQKNLVDSKCLSCHQEAKATNRNVDLRDIGKLFGNLSSSQRKDLIIPGCPKESMFLSILREGKMPPNSATKISEQDMKVIENWIKGFPPQRTNCNPDEPPDSRPPNGDEP